MWELADLFNGLMAIPNIIALIGLSKVVGRALEDYEKKFLAGETPEFGELAPVPADIPRYNGVPAQDPALRTQAAASPSPWRPAQPLPPSSAQCAGKRRVSTALTQT